jgi:electron transport complex protein RnfD
MKPMLTVSLPPHVHDKDSVKHLMWGVIKALVPAWIVAVVVFGWAALKVTVLAVGSAVLFEYLIQKFVLKAEPSISDGSAAVTGLLLAFNVPSTLPAWMVVLGSFIAIAVAKMSFGGLGNNPFNPALVARVFLLISFPVSMTTWPKPFSGAFSAVDGVTTATPLGLLKESIKNGESVKQILAQLPSYSDLFLGKVAGSLGEISTIALIVGGIYMLRKKIITWHIPASVLGSVALLSGVLWLANPARFADPVFQLLSGGIMLGAIFMATDLVTSPMTKKGMVIFGTGIGVLTVVIRDFGAYPEGVSFAILIMNAFVPLINRYCKPKRFGE